MDTTARLKDRLEQTVTAAKAIAARADAENRDYTTSEAVLVDRHLAEVRDLTNQLKAARADAKFRRTISALDGDAPAGQFDTGIFGGVKLGGGSSWASTVAAQLTKKAMISGTKDIAVGNLSVPSVIENAVQLPARPLRLLDAIPTKPLPGPSYAYVRQSLRDSHAGPVADHALKPVSQYVFEQTEDRARVFATITDPQPCRFFDDFAELMTLLDQELYVDLRRSIEDDIATGDGTGEHFLGLLNVSGTLAQPYEVSLPATLRAARLTLEAANETPTSWLMNVADIAAIDLLTDQEGRYFTGEINALMGNLPRIPTTAIPAGQAILADWSMSRLYVREEAALSLDGGGDLFRRNEIVMRYEGRYGWACLRPSAFCIVDLTP